MSQRPAWIKRAWTALMEMFVEQARDCGACVLFSTHHTDAVEAFADRVLTISQGRLVDGRYLDRLRRSMPLILG